MKTSSESTKFSRKLTGTNCKSHQPEPNQVNSTPKTSNSTESSPTESATAFYATTKAKIDSVKSTTSKFHVKRKTQKRIRSLISITSIILFSNYKPLQQSQITWKAFAITSPFKLFNNRRRLHQINLAIVTPTKKVLIISHKKIRFKKTISFTK
jgi:hypothetical protein